MFVLEMSWHPQRYWRWLEDWMPDNVPDRRAININCSLTKLSSVIVNMHQPCLLWINYSYYHVLISIVEHTITLKGNVSSSIILSATQESMKYILHVKFYQSQLLYKTVWSYTPSDHTPVIQAMCWGWR